jgi:hypothetical protein
MKYLRYFIIVFISSILALQAFFFLQIVAWQWFNPSVTAFQLAERHRLCGWSIPYIHPCGIKREWIEFEKEPLPFGENFVFKFKLKSFINKTFTDVDFGFNIVIIEVDEEQHRNYSCENRRTMEISKDFNHRPIVIIRFNPDSYINCKKETIQSCFKLDGKGLLIIRNKKDFENRLKVLYKQIEYWSNEKNINEKTNSQYLEIINFIEENSIIINITKETAINAAENCEKYSFNQAPAAASVSDVQLLSDIKNELVEIKNILAKKF